MEPSGRNLGLLLETNQLVLWHANNTRRSRVQHVAVGEQTIVPRAGGVIVVHRDGLLVLMKRPSGNFFPPSNQVDLIFEKSGQLFYWALEFQIGAQTEIKTKKTCMHAPRHVPKPNPKPRKAEGPTVLFYW